MEGVPIQILGRTTLKLFGSVKPRANGRNIVGQQLPTLLDVGCCCAKFETGQTFSYVQTDATTPKQCWELFANSVVSVCTRLYGQQLAPS